MDTGSPLPEVASITLLSCDEIGEVFTYDPQAPLDIPEVGTRREEGVTSTDLTYASPMGGRVPATLVIPDQAALHGILAKINELGLSIISVERVEPVQGENLES